MTKKDDAVLTVGTFKEMFKELMKENNKMLRKEIRVDMRGDMKEMIEENNKILTREMHQDIQQLIRASEKGMIERIDSSREAILEAISEIILPQIETNRLDILLLKRSLAVA